MRRLASNYHIAIWRQNDKQRPESGRLCIDNASRVAFVQILADQRKESAVAFLEAAVTYYAKLGIRIERVLTDNGSCYRSKSFRAVCKRLGLRQVFTKPYTPRTLM